MCGGGGGGGGGAKQSGIDKCQPAMLLRYKTQPVVNNIWRINFDISDLII